MENLCPCCGLSRMEHNNDACGFRYIPQVDEWQPYLEKAFKWLEEQKMGWYDD